MERTAGPRIDRLLLGDADAAPREASPYPSAKACSFHYPLCVSGRDPGSVLSTLSAAEGMWQLSQALDWPVPEKVTLELDADLDADIHVQFTQINTLSAFDAGLARARVLSTLKGCPLDHAVLRALLEVGTFSRSPGWKATLRDGFAASLADTVLACEGSDRAGRTARAQSNPEGDVFGFGSEARTEATAAPEIFFRWLDAHYGKSILNAVAAMTAGHTPAGSDRWVNEPDLFDVLGDNLRSLQFKTSTLADVVCDFGIDRYFFGRDRAAFPEAARLPPVKPDWEVPWPAAPRRLLGPRPLHPFGTTYVLIDLSGRNGHGLRMEAEWERFARIRWHFVKLDAAGHDIGRVPVPAPDKATEAQMTLSEPGSAAYLLLVGTNLGDPLEPFDPDWSSMEPHNYTVTLSSDRD
ncbi:MAG: hypothetical protein U0174_10470 [Polyangiaceae bacterium]